MQTKFEKENQDAAAVIVIQTKEECQQRRTAKLDIRRAEFQTQQICQKRDESVAHIHQNFNSTLKE